jgi:hypothetical protein
VPPRHRHRPHHPGLLRGRVPRLRARLRADPAARGVDALQLRRRRRSHGQEGPVLRDARHPRAVERGLEGGRRARAADEGRQLRERHLAATPHRRGPRRGPDLAAHHLDKVRQLVDLWYAEAGKYDVLPLDDRTTAELVAAMPVAPIPPGGIYVYYPGTLEVPEFTAANTRGRSYKILAEVQLTNPDAHGGAPGPGGPLRRSCPVRQGPQALSYVYNFIGIPPEQQLVADRELQPGNRVLGSSSPRSGSGSATRPTAPPGCTWTTRWWPRGHCAPARPLRHRRRGPVGRPRRRRRGQQGVHPGLPRSSAPPPLRRVRAVEGAGRPFSTPSRPPRRSPGCRPQLRVSVRWLACHPGSCGEGDGGPATRLGRACPTTSGARSADPARPRRWAPLHGRHGPPAEASRRTIRSRHLD